MTDDAPKLRVVAHFNGDLQVLKPDEPANGPVKRLLSGLNDQMFDYDPDLFERACEQLEAHGFVVNRAAQTFAASGIEPFTIQVVDYSDVVAKVIEPLGIDPDELQELLDSKHSWGDSELTLISLRVFCDDIREAYSEDEGNKIVAAFTRGLPHNVKICLNA